MKVLLVSLLLNEEEWLEKNYLQHKDWSDMLGWVFVHGADSVYGETNPDRVTRNGLSVDRTGELLDEIARNDSRVQVIHHGWMNHPNRVRDQGKVEGRNRYLQVADEMSPDIIVSCDLDEFYTHEDQERINTLYTTPNKLSRSFPCGSMLRQRHIWYPPIYREVSGIDTSILHPPSPPSSSPSILHPCGATYAIPPLFSQEVIGGYWNVPHCRIWRWQRGMRHTSNHNTPDGFRYPARLDLQDQTGLPQCIHMGYASSLLSRKSKHRYYEVRGEGKEGGRLGMTRKMYCECRSAYEGWRPGNILPHRAQIIEYKGSVPEVFREQETTKSKETIGNETFMG